MELLEGIACVVLVIVLLACTMTLCGPRAYMKPDTPKELRPIVQKKVNEENKAQNIAFTIIFIICAITLLVTACQQGL